MASSGLSDPVHQSNTTAMDSARYKAAIDGRFEAFSEEHDFLDKLLTPNRNTVLHIHITAAKSGEKYDLAGSEFVEQILQRFPALLFQANVKGETPLHMAARYGHTRIVEILIEREQAAHPEDLESIGEAANRMLRMRNKRGDTALHEAVRFNHLRVVQILAAQDPDFVYSKNNDGEMPLYIAVERGHCELAVWMLSNFQSPTTNGPFGRSVLHVATIENELALVDMILRKTVELTRQMDDNSWTPLHYAARLGRASIVKKLLEFDKGASHAKDGRGRTPLHIAALNGECEVMKEIMASFPGCCELVDNKGCNVLHYAARNNDTKAVRLILNDTSLSNLLNDRNDDGNTPLHECAAAQALSSFMLLAADPRVDNLAFNGENKNVFDVVSTGQPSEAKSEMQLCLLSEGVKPCCRIVTEDRGEAEKVENLPKVSEPSWVEKTLDSSLIVAALIATVTFAAGFTIPGGFMSDRGSAILTEKASFKVFMISDTIAMVLSSLTVFLIVLEAMGRDNHRSAMNGLWINRLLMLSILAMVVAFVAGTFAFLDHSRSLSISTCVVGSSFFVFFVVMVYKNNA